MQLEARLAATLLALTWTAPVVQAAAVFQDRSRVHGVGPDPVLASTHIADGRPNTSALAIVSSAHDADLANVIAYLKQQTGQ